VNDLERELNIQGLRAAFLRYTREAFEKLPAMEQAKILDIGCGAGASMFELARLCSAEILGIDIDRNALATLEAGISDAGLSDRLKVVECSLLAVDFSDETFDVLWEEGTLHIIDTERALAECRRLLKPGGYLVVAETIGWFETTQPALSAHGFELVDSVLWAEGCWWTEYYSPLEQRLRGLRDKYRDSKEAAALKRYEDEVAMVKKDPSLTNCGHFIMQKTPGRTSTEAD
jgi:ubiquinone/menaquinone biosynthesis C-methylase UbiE